MSEAVQVAGLDDLGCRVVGIPNGKLGDVLQMLPGPGGTLTPGFGPDPGGPGGGGPTTVGIAWVGDNLQVTVNGVTDSVQVRGSIAQDLMGNTLGYWLLVS